MLMFEWKPTEMTSGKIQFVATILKDRPTFWLGVKSVVLEKMVCNYACITNFYYYISKLQNKLNFQLDLC